ncbi:DUF11 domain-containing protein [Streptomyces phaeofaciens]|uniref:DUF11 domain-containing protein n=1 Tax=Streptomyces phaeofaciens TaxID=68254 RepID=UPI001E62A15A|nr:DUF11 domain-containing protein [Streptomyces phaeofaciens]
MRRAVTGGSDRFVLRRPRRRWPNRLRALGAAFLLTTAGVLFAAAPAHASSSISVSSSTVAAGDTFTISFTGTSDFARRDAGFNFYAGANPPALGTLDTFTTIESCTGNTGPCVNQPSLGPRVPLGDLNAGDPFSGSITLRINPGTPAGTFLLRYQLFSTPDGGEATENGPIISVTVPPSADLGVSLTARPHLGLLVPYLSYTATLRNTGPSAVTSATLTAVLPAGRTATRLSPGCTSSPGSVTCTYGAIADGGNAVSTFRLPMSVLALGRVDVTATRTASAPGDPNAANDSASAGCRVISVFLATCP